MSNPIKSLGYIKCYSWAGMDLLKGLAILSGITVRRLEVNWEDLKAYWKSEGHISLGDQQDY